MKKDKKYYFEKAPIYSSILFFAIPTIISQLITLIYNWADTFFVGQLTNELLITAVSVCHPAFMITSVIANLFGIGGASVISRALGVNNENKVKKMATFSILWATIVGIIYSILVFALRVPILKLCGASDATMEFAEEYLFWVVVIGALPSVLSATFGHLVRSIGKTKIASFGIVLGAVTNIILDPILIYGFNMDIVGAAIATTISNVLASLFFIVYLSSVSSEEVVLLVRMLGRSEPCHILHKTENRFVDILVAEHVHAFLNIGQSHILRRAHDYGSFERNVVNEADVDITCSRGHVYQKEVKLTPTYLKNHLFECIASHWTTPDESLFRTCEISD